MVFNMFPLTSSPSSRSIVPIITTIHGVADNISSQSTYDKFIPNSMKANILQLSILAGKIELIAPTYDRPGYKKANGFRSVIKVINKFVPILIEFTSLDCPANVQRLINEHEHSPSKYVNSINGVLLILIELCNLTIDCHKNWHLIKDPKEKFLWLQRTYRYSYEKLLTELQEYWTYHEMFWYEPSIRNYLSYTVSAFATLSKPPLSLLSLLSRRERGSRMTSIAWKGDPFFQTTVINLIDNPLVNNINRLFFKFCGISIRNLNIPRQKNWIIPFDGKPVIRMDENPASVDNSPSSSSNTCDSIRIRVYQVDNLPPSGTVIVHIQGGGFMVDAHAIHSSYLKSWLPQLAGAIVINIDYSMSVRYPVALQEIVDGLLWLINPDNGDQIASTLQFIPKKLIILGDSCGGYLGLAACAVLRDIKDQSPSTIGIFPHSIVCLSPVMAPVNLNYAPSLLLSILDPFLCPTLNLQVLSLYSTGITLDSECQSTIDLPSTSSSSSSGSSKVTGYVKESRWFTLSRCLFGGDACWFDCDPITFEKRLNKLTDKLFHPYISILTSYDLIRLTSLLKIHLITSDLDVQLDSALEFERVWKGPLTIDIIDDLPHGFYAFSMFSDTARKAAQVCLDRLKQAVDCQTN